MSHPSEGATGRPVLRSISPEATPEEVAAIVAAIESAVAISGAALDASDAESGDTLNEWTRGSRLGARRAGLQRGPWRLSGRIGRRSRA